MAHLSITCLGGFAAALDGQPITNFRSAKTRALLVYLAVEAGRAHQRESLIDLLWSGQALDKANANFRQSLSRLQRVIGNKQTTPPFLDVTRQTVTWNPDSDHSLDVTALRRAVADFPAQPDPARLRAALDCYHGDFLAGFFVDDAPEFEDWAATVREELHRALFEGLGLLADHLDATGDFGGIAELAHRQLALIPWDESAHRRLMWALALQGQRNQALAQYDHCFDLLAEELGVEPGDETAALYEQIATGVVAAQAADEPLPRPETPFVGRVAEISHILRSLARPDCRVLTLVGPGGAGKTRLGLEVARRFQEETGNEVVYVSLLGVTDAPEALAALARVLKLVVVSSAQAGQMVAAALADREALVLLDNAEPLLDADGDAFVAWLNGVVAGPNEPTEGVRVLVTSRHPLHSRAEWVLPVEGMAVPAGADLPPARWLDYDAVALFAQRARQARVDFALTHSNIGHVLDICRAVDGLPLGLELAAAQIRGRSLAEIAAALADAPGELAADLRDLPQRHRAMRTVIAHSWAALSNPARSALARCALFAGPFGRAAARAILGEDAEQITGLVERSLLRRRMRTAETGSPLHFLSPPVRAFLLAEHPPADAARDRHAAFYLAWAAEHPRMAAAEVENVAAAWAWAQSNRRVQPPEGWDPAWLERASGRVVSVAATPSPPPNTLAGRTQELARLRAALDPLISHRRNAGLLLISGEAGIGKTFLADALQQETTGAVWFPCPCDEVDRRSLQPIRRALRRYFGQPPNPSAGVDRAAFDARFADLLHATGDERLRADLREASSFLAALVDIVVPDSPYTRMQPEARRQQMQMALRALVRAESHLQPLIIHVEDGHWLDGESREVLASLLRGAQDYPYAIVITARPARFDPPALLDAPLHTVTLDPLDPAGVTALTTAHLRTEPEPALVDLLLDRAGGNPFYTVQILTYLQESGLVVGGALREGAGDSPDVPVPMEVFNVLTARLGRLAEGTRSVVAQASVLGSEFSVTELQALAGDGAAVQAALQEVSQQEILHPVGAGRYGFNHALLHAAAYDSQFDSQRRDIHRRAAQAIAGQPASDQPDYARMAHHWDEAGDAQRAARSYLRAGDQARENYFIREAHSHYSRGLALAENDLDRLALHRGREEVNYWLGNREEQREDLDALTGLLGAKADPALLADVALRRATFYLTVTDYAQAVQHAQRATALAAAIHDQALEAKAYHRWGRALWQQGRGRSAQPLLERAWRLAQAAEEPVIQAQCQYDLGVIAGQANQFERARRHFREAVQQFEAINDKHNTIRCTDALGQIDVLDGSFEAGMGYFERALSLCQAVDWTYGESLALAHLGDCYFELGQFALCREMHEKAIRIARGLGERRTEVISLDTIGLCYQLEGDMRTAESIFQEALAMHQQVAYPRGKAFVQTHLGLTLADLEELEQAGIVLYDALSARQEADTDSMAVDTEAALAWLDMARGDRVFATERAQSVVAWLQEHGTAGVELPLRVYWQCYVILQAAGKQAEAAETLEQAHGLLQRLADRIQNEELRASYLTGAPYHRNILEAWRRAADDQ